VPGVNNLYTTYGSNAGKVIVLEVFIDGTDAANLAWANATGGTNNGKTKVLPPLIMATKGGSTIFPMYRIGGIPSSVLISPEKKCMDAPNVTYAENAISHLKAAGVPTKVLPTYALTLSTGTTGGGTITKSPNLSVYDSGATVTLTAVPNTGYKFTSWSGAVTGTTNPTTVKMTSAKSVSALFSTIVSVSEVSSGLIAKGIGIRWAATAGIVTINTPGAADIAMTTLDGRIVASVGSRGGEQTLVPARLGLSRGVYIVRVNAGTMSKSQIVPID